MTIIATNTLDGLTEFIGSLKEEENPTQIVADPQLAAQIPGCVAISDPRNLLEELKNTPTIYYRYLSKFSNVDFIRHSICVGATNNVRGLTIIEPAGDLRIASVIHRAAGCASLSVRTEPLGTNVKYVVAVPPGDLLNPYSNDDFVERSVGFRIPKIGAETLVEMAIQSLKDGTGFSFVRFNHCEPRVMGYRQFFYDVDLDSTFNIQWGQTKVAESERIALAQKMKEALFAADVVGVPNFNRMISTKLHILENSFAALCASLAPLKQGVRFCNVNMHFRLKDEDFHNIIRAAASVHLITGRDVVEVLRESSGRRDIHQIVIPAEHKFGGDHTEIPHYPDRMNQVVSEIGTTAGPGALFLVGGGIIGKHYCAAVKQAGGVALDLGSRFDIWAGLRTRGSPPTPPKVV